LARWQADWVAGRLAESGVAVELVPITTRGDVHSGPIESIGGRGLFTKQIQQALLDGRVDLAVHSLKDLPTEPVPGLTLAAVPPRAAPGDALVARAADSLEQLPEGASVGTGSARRRAQLLSRRPDLVVKEIRGNVDTRLRKLDEGQYDAIVLAEAGLSRLGLADRITEVLPKSVMLPAVGQGALGLEIRVDDAATCQALAPLDHLPTHAAVTAERAMLAALRGGCLAPVGAWGRVGDGNSLQLDGVVLSNDGRTRLAASAVGPPEQAGEVGVEVAEKLIAKGARDLIAASRT